MSVFVYTEGGPACSPFGEVPPAVLPTLHVLPSGGSQCNYIVAVYMEQLGLVFSSPRVVNFLDSSCSFIVHAL